MHLNGENASAQQRQNMVQATMHPMPLSNDTMNAEWNANSNFNKM